MKELRKDPNATTEEQLQYVIDFLKMAFCIDGECKYIKKPKVFSTHFELTDSKRGKFIVCLK